MPKLNSTQPFHFYASTAFAWGTGITRDDAIRMALEGSGSYAKKREGSYVWSTRVELPQTATYRIEYYKPVGVPLSEGQDGKFALKTRKRTVVKVGEA